MSDAYLEAWAMKGTPESAEQIFIDIYLAISDAGQPLPFEVALELAHDGGGSLAAGIARLMARYGIADQLGEWVAKCLPAKEGAKIAARVVRGAYSLARAGGTKLSPQTVEAVKMMRRAVAGGEAGRPPKMPKGEHWLNDADGCIYDAAGNVLSALRHDAPAGSYRSITSAALAFRDMSVNPHAASKYSLGERPLMALCEAVARRSTGVRENPSRRAKRLR